MEGQGPKHNYLKAKTGTNTNTTATEESDVTSPKATYVMSVKTGSRPSTSPLHKTLKPSTDPENRQNYPILGNKDQCEGYEGEKGDIHSYHIIQTKDCNACQGHTSLYSPPLPAIQTFLNSGVSELRALLGVEVWLHWVHGSTGPRGQQRYTR